VNAGRESAPGEPAWGSRLRAAGVRQALVAELGSCVPAARASLWEDGAGGWARIWDCAEAVVGRAGFAVPGAKREGDGQSPSGIFGISLAFGYATTADTVLPYRVCTAADLWVDDPASPDYNRWVTAPHPARSAERMRRADGLYEFGLVLDYNRDPVVPGAGSAIFVHVRDERGGGTAGCLALPRAELCALLRLLRPEVVAVFNPGALAA
jgi:L,D-peptidoglycan transpeptidase YkuD (ErfK/YbiS/YcfS/YnhG family)